MKIFKPHVHYTPEEIQQIVNDEAEVEHVKDFVPRLPVYDGVRVKKNAVWWINFFRSNVFYLADQFRP